jgi:hypothetical protein
LQTPAQVSVSTESTEPLLDPQLTNILRQLGVDAQNQPSLDPELPVEVAPQLIAPDVAPDTTTIQQLVEQLLGTFTNNRSGDVAFAGQNDEVTSDQLNDLPLEEESAADAIVLPNFVNNQPVSVPVLVPQTNTTNTANLNTDHCHFRRRPAD